MNRHLLAAMTGLAAAAAIAVPTFAAGPAPSAAATPGAFADRTEFTFPDKAGRLQFITGEAKPGLPAQAGYQWIGEPAGGSLVLYAWPVGNVIYSQTLPVFADRVEARLRRISAFKIVEVGARKVVPSDGPPPAQVPGRPPIARAGVGLRQDFLIEALGKRQLVTEFLFYRHWYVLQLAVYSPANSLDDPAALRYAEEVKRSLLPLVDVRNFGSCGLPSASQLPNDPPIRARLEEAKQQVAEEYNCHPPQTKTDTFGGHRYVLENPVPMR